MVVIKSISLSKRIIIAVTTLLICFNTVSVSAESIPEPESDISISETEISEIVTTVVSEISELPSDSNSESGSESAIVIPDVNLDLDFKNMDKRQLLQYAKPLVRVVVQYCLVELGIVLPDEVVDLLTDLVTE